MYIRRYIHSLYYSQDLYLFKVISGVQDLEHTVTDVIEGKEYLFSVIACNKCGPGEPAYTDEAVNVSSPASKFYNTVR